jgi:hypothetical protein
VGHAGTVVEQEGYWRQDRLVDSNGRKMIAQRLTMHELTSVSSLCIPPIGNDG